jgi:hypothetical protein
LPVISVYYICYTVSVKTKIMDVVRLRTLTAKSIIGFGRYRDLSVQQMIDIHKVIYLRWMYFNCFGISFTEDVLNRIGVFSNLRIEKPGANTELWDKILDGIDESLKHGLKGYIIKCATKSHRKAHLTGYNATLKRELNKGKLQYINQGHK